MNHLLRLEDHVGVGWWLGSRVVRRGRRTWASYSTVVLTSRELSWASIRNVRGPFSRGWRGKPSSTDVADTAGFCQVIIPPSFSVVGPQDLATHIAIWDRWLFSASLADGRGHVTVPTEESWGKGRVKISRRCLKGSDSGGRPPPSDFPPPGLEIRAAGLEGGRCGVGNWVPNDIMSRSYQIWTASWDYFYVGEKLLFFFVTI